jgi:hypothetical protein
LEVFVKNGKHFAVPKNIDETRPSGLTFHFNRRVDWDLN